MSHETSEQSSPGYRRRDGTPLIEPIWSRQPGETGKAYAAFLAYRDLGGTRTIEKAAGVIGRHSTSSKWKVTGVITGWSSRYAWILRSRAWDNYLQEERDQATRMAAAKEAGKEAAKWERRRQTALEDNYQLAIKMRKVSSNMLEAPLFEETIEEDEDGKKTTTLKPAKWGFSSASLLARTAAEIEAGVLNASSRSLADLSPEELEAVAQACAEPSDSDEPAMLMAPVAVDQPREAVDTYIIIPDDPDDPELPEVHPPEEVVLEIVPDLPPESPRQNFPETPHRDYPEGQSLIFPDDDTEVED